jgi:hypothetical protein
LKARWRTLKANAQRAFPSWAYRDGIPEILGYQVPGPKEAVVEMYGRFTPPLPRDEREGIYDYLSNHVHPTPYVIRELFSAQSNHDGGMDVKLVIDPDYHPKLARIALEGWC